MRGLDFSSLQNLIFTLAGLAFITLIGVGIRLLVMQTIQQKRERENRQINERLRTLIAAYKILGGSFTGNLKVNPTHLHDIKQSQTDDTQEDSVIKSSERARRIRDAVEGALSDIILLGTDEQVRLAAKAAEQLAAGQIVHTAELVVSLRDFIRKTLGFTPIPEDLFIPKQGPTRPTTSPKGKQHDSKEEGGGRNR